MSSLHFHGPATRTTLDPPGSRARNKNATQSPFRSSIVSMASTVSSESAGMSPISPQPWLQPRESLSSPQPRESISLPPRWKESPHCFMCYSQFRAFNKRHHCRNCGESICSKHSAKQRRSLPHLGLQDKHRVCLKCDSAFRSFMPHLNQSLHLNHQSPSPQYPVLGTPQFSKPMADIPQSVPSNEHHLNQSPSCQETRFGPVPTADAKIKVQLKGQLSAKPNTERKKPKGSSFKFQDHRATLSKRYSLLRLESGQVLAPPPALRFTIHAHKTHDAPTSPPNAAFNLDGDIAVSPPTVTQARKGSLISFAQLSTPGCSMDTEFIDACANDVLPDFLVEEIEPPKDDLFDLLWVRGQNLMIEENYAEAIVIFNQIIVQVPDHDQAHFLLAKVLLKTRNLDRAETAAKASYEIQAKPETAKLLGQIRTERGAYDEAMEAFQLALDSHEQRNSDIMVL